MPGSGSLLPTSSPGAGKLDRGFCVAGEGGGGGEKAGVDDPVIGSGQRGLVQGVLGWLDCPSSTYVVGLVHQYPWVECSMRRGAGAIPANAGRNSIGVDPMIRITFVV